ncbi:hypothetical protein F511_13386 [Dorcoceras hygrometricum]|uniref:Uncharacterized protein n=1 Tax=Dorcoceras hygrometricum TaxID=472368 RepID=A0A2Z7B0D4_9LAMI|nr:hypothetical protein F511_13386 [Dorcoceras hygrometricum]
MECGTTSFSDTSLDASWMEALGWVSSELSDNYHDPLLSAVLVVSAMRRVENYHVLMRLSAPADFEIVFVGILVDVISPIRSTTGYETPSSPCTRRRDEICTDGFSSSNWPEQIPAKRRRRRLVERRGAAVAI